MVGLGYLPGIANKSIVDVLVCILGIAFPSSSTSTFKFASGGVGGDSADEGIVVENCVVVVAVDTVAVRFREVSVSSLVFSVLGWA